MELIKEQEEFVLTRRQRARDYAVAQHHINDVLGSLANKFEISETVIKDASRLIKSGRFFDANDILRMIAAQNQNKKTFLQPVVEEKYAPAEIQKQPEIATKEIVSEAILDAGKLEQEKEEPRESNPGNSLGNSLGNSFYTNIYERNTVIAGIAYTIAEQLEELHIEMDMTRLLQMAQNYAQTRNDVLRNAVNQNLSMDYTGFVPAAPKGYQNN